MAEFLADSSSILAMEDDKSTSVDSGTSIAGGSICLFGASCVEADAATATTLGLEEHSTSGEVRKVRKPRQRKTLAIDIVADLFDL